MEGLTPIKQDLFAAKKRIGQQDGKIILLSSQLEKKKLLLEEFQEKVQILTQTVQEKDSLIDSLSRKIQDERGKSNDELQALLRHIHRSNDFRYVISGREDHKYLLRSPVMLKSIHSRSNNENYTVMVDRDVQTLTISPSSIKKQQASLQVATTPGPPSQSLSVKKVLFEADKVEDKENQKARANCTFTSDIEGLAHNAIFKKVLGSSSQGSAKRSGSKSSRKVELVVIENPLEDTFVADADLTCYPLDDDVTIPSSSPRPRPTQQSSHPGAPTYVDNVYVQGTHTLATLSPTRFYEKVGDLRHDNEKLKKDISRFKGRLEVSVHHIRS